jgi:hypothetical protein
VPTQHDLNKALPRIRNFSLLKYVRMSRSNDAFESNAAAVWDVRATGRAGTILTISPNPFVLLRKTLPQ